MSSLLLISVDPPEAYTAALSRLVTPSSTEAPGSLAPGHWSREQVDAMHYNVT
jgi:hypothetical protein